MAEPGELEKVMIIGSGPIQIGEAAEFDYSGSQACKALQEEGLEVVLVNSNPATIMTDPEMADAVYIEPLDAESLERIVKRERPDGIAAGLGGQKALNATSELADRGVLEKFDVDVLGCSLDTIETTEDRELFKQAMEEIDEKVSESCPVNSLDEAKRFAEENGYPLVVRPAYTLGGSGGGIARNEQQLEDIVSRGLKLSRIDQVLLEECIEGWKEYEYEVMRDGNDTAITVVNMENVDPLGIHTGDSCVVAPSQTLSDREHQELRSAALKIIRHLDIEGGCNIQFAVDPDTGEYRVIEVNPRVSRSSALASKATGYPIARVAAKIAVGKDLHEIDNDITEETPASFEPMVDYTVVKIPRWPFEKLEVEDRLTTQMKGTGEVMAIGRTLEEAFMKAFRSLDLDRYDGLEELDTVDLDPNSMRLFSIYTALKQDRTVEEIAEETGIDSFYIHKLANVVELEQQASPADLGEMKRNGLLDSEIADVTDLGKEEVRQQRKEQGVAPAYKMVDTCAGEFRAETPFYYSSFERENELPESDGEKYLIVGGGPIRIGQGIEFDYSCVHAVRGISEQGGEALMVNNNPETVSTDYDVPDTLFFEPITPEEIADVLETTGAGNVMVQFGGQTSVDMAVDLEEEIEDRGLDCDLVGTHPDRIDSIEDRSRFDSKAKELGIKVPESGSAESVDEARQIAEKIGYPVLVRPSYVIGGRAMEIVRGEDELERYMEEAVEVSPDRPVLVDDFLEDAVELDIDAVSDGEETLIGGVMEHVEPAGVHSGDSACVLPPQFVSREAVEQTKQYVRRIASEFDITGFLNVQLAVKDGKVYVLEANPRASRTVPFVSKHTGVPLARLAARVQTGEKLADMDIEESRGDHVSVKEVVFPFDKFEEIEMELGPEMKSTGEVMGIDDSFGRAYFKAQKAAGNELPLEGEALVVDPAGELSGEVEKLSSLGFEVEVVEEPGNLELDHDLLLDLSSESELKREAFIDEVPYFSTVQAFRAGIRAIESMQGDARARCEQLSEYQP